MSQAIKRAVGPATLKVKGLVIRLPKEPNRPASKPR